MRKLIIGLIMTITLAAKAEHNTIEQIDELPIYIAWEEKSDTDKMLRRKTIAFSFPLSLEDKRDIDILEKKFDGEESCSGLAAPQIGISKKAIVFHAPNDPKLKKWRTDLTQTMPKSIWLNPSFEPIGSEMSEAFEACFSVPNTAGPVKRYTKIKYKAYDINGNLIQGEAEGFLARVIQHEIDHLNGKLYIDYVAKEDMLTMEEYRERRKKAMEVMQEE
jgi:peptide deformylase